MAYDPTVDLEQIQADVLTKNTSTNSKITSLNKLKTDQKSITKAINFLNGQLESAVKTANDASNKADMRTTEQQVDNAIDTALDGYTPSGGSSFSLQSDEFRPDSVTATFTLTKEPVDVNNILFYVNGIKYSRADWTYDAEANSVTWTNTDTGHKGFVICENDVVSIVYAASQGA